MLKIKEDNEMNGDNIFKFMTIRPPKKLTDEAVSENFLEYEPRFVSYNNNFLDMYHNAVGWQRNANLIRSAVNKNTSPDRHTGAQPGG